MLVALEASPLPKQKTPPKRILLAKWGRNESTRGPVMVNETTASVLPRMQKLGGGDRVALDFQHNTVPGEAEYERSQEPRPVAAFGTPLVVPGEGLYLDNLDWTEPGTKSYSEGHYADYSPAVKQTDDGTVVFVHSAALVRNGSIEGIHVFSAHADPFFMNEKLLALFGLKADASDKQINDAVTAFQAKMDAFASFQEQVTTFSATIEGLKSEIATLKKGSKAAPAVGDPTAEALTGITESIKAFTATVDDLQKQVKAMEASGEQRERDVLLDKAIRAGKIVPHSAEDLPVEKLAKLIDELPADQVPLEKRTREGLKTFSASGVATGDDASADAVRRQLGISKEEWAKQSAAA